LGLLAAVVIAIGLFAILPFASWAPWLYWLTASGGAGGREAAAGAAAADSAFGSAREEFSAGLSGSYGGFGGASYSSGGFGGADFGSPGAGGAALTREDPSHMGLDFTLVVLLTVVIAVCILPPSMRALSCATTWPPPPCAPAPMPWGQCGGQPQLQGPPPLLGSPGAAMGNPFAASQDMLAGAARGRIIDVKPGELRGVGAGSDGGFAGPFGGFGGAFGGWGGQDANSMDWTPTPQVAAGGSFGTPVPSPWSGAWQGGLSGFGMPMGVGGPAVARPSWPAF